MMQPLLLAPNQQPTTMQPASPFIQASARRRLNAALWLGQYAAWHSLLQ
jgi:hypothetical protein